MIGIIRDRRAAEMVDGIAAPAVLVGELPPQTVDIAAATLKGQVPEHVIKRAVLEHQNDDVVDLLQVGHADLLIDHTCAYVNQDLAARGRAGLPARERDRLIGA